MHDVKEDLSCDNLVATWDVQEAGGGSSSWHRAPLFWSFELDEAEGVCLSIIYLYVIRTYMDYIDYMDSKNYKPGINSKPFLKTLTGRTLITPHTGPR